MTGAVEWASSGSYASTVPSSSHDGRYVSFSSSSAEYVTGDTNEAADIFVRDLGPELGGGGMRASSGDGGNVRIEGAPRFARTGVVHLSDANPDSLSELGDGSELVGATIAYRHRYSDLYFKIDVDHMPGPRGVAGISAAGNPAIVYGARFSVGNSTYELRAHKGLYEPVIGLFDCNKVCSEVAKLQGGYGTVGDSVVAAVPLHVIGLGAGGSIQNLEVFSAIGSYTTGAVRLLDVASLR